MIGTNCVSHSFRECVGTGARNAFTRERVLQGGSNMSSKSQSKVDSRIQPLNALLKVFISVVLVVGLCPIPAHAESGSGGDSPLGATSFSTMSVTDTDVASIDDTGYASLEEAIREASNNETIVLQKDISVSSTIAIDKSITINLAGHKITSRVEASRLFWLTVSNIEFTLIGTTDGSSIKIADDVKSWGLIDVRENSSNTKINIDGGTYIGDSDNAGFFKVRGNYTSITLKNIYAKTNYRFLDSSPSKGLTLDIGNSTFKQNNLNVRSGGFTVPAFYIEGASSVSFNGTNITSDVGACVELAATTSAVFGNQAANSFTVTDKSDTTSWNNTAIAIDYGSSVKVMDGIYSAPKGHGLFIFNSGGTAIIEDGTFSGGISSIRTEAVSGVSSNITITGGVFDGIVNANASSGGSSTITISGGTFSDELKASSNSSIKISGGEFAKEVNSYYCAEGYTPVSEKSASGLYVVASNNAVAMIDGTSYGTLANAFSSAKNGDTVELIKDTTSGTATVSDKNISFDLREKTLTVGANEGIASTSSGNLTITNGTIKSDKDDIISANGGFIKLGEDLAITSSSSAIYAYNGGTVDVEGAVVTGSKYVTAFATGKNSAINVKSGSIYSTNCNAVAAKNNATVTVSGGKVYTGGTNTYPAGYSASGGSIIISGAGEASSESGYGLIAASQGVIEVEGGTVTGKSGILVHENNSSSAIISGGTVKGTAGIGVYVKLGEAEIQGGSIIGTGSSSVKADDRSGTLKITGGSFSDDAGNVYTIPEGQGLVKQADGTYSLALVVAKNSTSNENYASLAEAIAAAAAGNTVELLKDADSSQSISIGKEININLNGHTYAYSGNGFAFALSSSADLTVDGTIKGSAIKLQETANGIFSLETTAKLSITGSDSNEDTLLSGNVTERHGLIYLVNENEVPANGATVSLTNVNATSNRSVFTSYETDDNSDYYTYATVTITGGNYERTGTSSVGANEKALYLVAANATLKDVTVVSAWGPAVEFSGAADLKQSYQKTKSTVTNCTFTSSTTPSTWYNSGLALSWDADVTVNGGAYSGDYGAYIYSSGGNLTVNSGTFTGATAAFRSDINASYVSNYGVSAHAALKDGVFNGAIVRSDGTDIDIEGGLYSEDVPASTGVDFPSGKALEPIAEGNNAGKYALRLSLKAFDITVNPAWVLYNGNQQSAIVTATAKVADTTLTAADYEVQYKVKGAEDSTYTATAPTNVGDYVVRLSGKGDYADTVSEAVSYSIGSVALISASIADLEYNGQVLTPEVTVQPEGAQYQVAYGLSEVKNAATYTATITGTGNYSGTIAVEFKVNPKAITDSMISGFENLVAGNAGNAIVVKDGDVELSKGTDYTITDDVDLTVAGKKSVTITGTNNYSGAVSKTFTVSPAIARYNDVNYASLKAAVEDAAQNDNGGTVTLLSNTEESFWVPDEDKSIAIDLGGKTLTGFVGIDDGPRVTVSNGTIKGEVDVCASDTDEPDHNRFTLAQGAKIDGSGNDGFALILREAYGTSGSNGFGSTITIDGEINGTVWVMGNINADGANLSTINVNGKITNGDPGIALNGNAILNVGASADISGITGIEVRSGTLNVNGGTIVGTGYADQTEVKVSPTGSGTTTDGAGIAIAQHVTKHAIKISIADGDISGIAAIYQSDPQGNNDVENVDVSISGGTFSSTVTDGTALYVTQDKTSKVSGGWFQQIVPEEDCAEGYVPVYESGVDGTGEVIEGKSGLYTVTSGSFVARNTTTGRGYLSLREAVAAATAGDVVTLLADASEAGVAIGSAITLDLGGKTYAVTGGEVSSTADATITNGAISKDAAGAVVSAASGTLTLEGVTVAGAAGSAVLATGGEGAISFVSGLLSSDVDEGVNVSFPAGKTLEQVPEGKDNAGMYEVRSSLGAFDIAISPTSVVYNGSKQPAKTTVVAGDIALLVGTDYTIEYKSKGAADSTYDDSAPTNAGEYTVKLVGALEYEGTESAEFDYTIEQATVDAVEVEALEYTGEVLVPKLDVKAGTLQLATSDYVSVIDQAEVKNAGTYKTTVTGKGNFKGSVIKEFTVAKRALADGMVDVKADGLVAGNPDNKIDVVVTDGETVLAKGTDYTVSDVDLATEGEKSVTITGAGNYTGEVVKAFRVSSAKIKVASTDADGVVSITNYATLADAVGAAENGDTVTLLEDVEEAGVSIQSAITLDLNGNTYTVVDTPVTTKADGVSIAGGKIKSGSVDNLVTVESGTLTLDDGVEVVSAGTAVLVKYLAGLTVQSAIVTSSSAESSTLVVQGTSDISGGVIQNTSSGTALEVGTEGTVTVSGGVIESESGKSVSNDNENSEITISGGMFKGSDPAITSNAGYPLAMYPIEQPDGTYVIGYSLASPDIEVAIADEEDGPEALSYGTYVFTGSEIKPTVVVKITGKENVDENDLPLSSGLTTQAIAAGDVAEGTTLVLGEDYTVDYGDNTDVGTATITIAGAEDGLFKGTSTKRTFVIQAAEIDFVSAGALTYNASEQEPELTVKVGSLELSEGDYAVEYAVDDSVEGNNAKLGDTGKPLNAGSYKVTVTGANNYTGEVSTTFEVDPALAVLVIGSISDQVYTGSAIEPANIARVIRTSPATGVEYVLAYADNTAVGTATVTATATGNYTGSDSGTFKIVSADTAALSALISASESDKASVTVAADGSDLDPEDQWVSEDAAKELDDAIAAANTVLKASPLTEAQVTAAVNALQAAKEAFDQAKNVGTFARSLNDATMAGMTATYTGEAIEVHPTVTLAGETLAEGVDYAIVIHDENGGEVTPVNAGSYTIVAKGIGRRSDQTAATLTVAPADISSASVTTEPVADYTGSQIAPVPAVTLGTNALQAGIDYTVSYGENIRPGATAGVIVVAGAGNYTGTVTAYFQIRGNIADATIKLSPTSYVYNSKARKPAAIVTFAGITLTSGVDYKVSYAANKSIGTATVTVTGKGSYIGSQKTTFKIKPATPTVKSISKVGAGVKLKWTNVAGATNYQVYRKVGSGSWKKVGTTEDTSYVNAASPGKKCSYRVVAVTKVGSKSYKSAKSNIKSMTLPKPSVTYRAFVKGTGWQDWSEDGDLAGTTGKHLRVSGLKVKLADKPYSGGIAYRTHMKLSGWEDEWRQNGQTAGTADESQRVEAVQIKLTKKMAKRYDVYYRAHCQSFGWLGWAKNGQKAGTSGYSYRLEGLEVVLVKKGGDAPGRTSGHFKQQ